MSLCRFAPVLRCARCRRERHEGQPIDGDCPAAAAAGQPCELAIVPKLHRCRRCGHDWRSSRPTSALPPRNCPVPSDEADVVPLDMQFATWPCPHRQAVQQTVPCGQCGLRDVPIEVASCPLHGACVPSPVRARPDLVPCNVCPDRPRLRTIPAPAAP